MLIGCKESGRSQGVAAEVTESHTQLPFTGLDAGERPASIKGAEYRNIHFFHQNHPSRITAACIEGTYSRRYRLFGTTSTILKCPECGADVEVFGNELMRYDIPVGSRVLVRGQIHGGQIENCTVVTQEAIDDALDHQKAHQADNVESR